MNGEIERLLTRINDDPDLLHGDLTPAVDGLIRHGLEALPYILPLLEEGDESTRLHAQRVLEGVTRQRATEEVQERPLTREGDRAWQELWRENGGYDWRAPEEARRVAVGRWREWLERETGGPTQA